MVAWQGRTVAITGATGFLGLHLVRELRRHGAAVTALVRASSKVERLRAAGADCRVAALDDAPTLARAIDGSEVVFHLAGAVGFGNQWEPYFRVNVAGTQRLLEAAQHAGVRRFIHTSSICAVGATQTPMILDENASWNLGACRVPYVTTKRLAEEAALAATRGGLDVVVVNPASVIGPDDFDGSEIGKLCQRFWRGRLPFHFRGGNSFVDVRDVARGIRLAAERGRTGERYLLAGANRSYDDFFNDLCRAAGRSIPRLRLPLALAPLLGYVSDQVYRQRTRDPLLSRSRAALMGLYMFFDSTKARRELGYETRPLAQSLADAHAFWAAPRRQAA